MRSEVTTPSAGVRNLIQKFENNEKGVCVKATGGGVGLGNDKGGVQLGALCKPRLLPTSFLFVLLK